MDKESVVCVCVYSILLSHKKEWDFAICNNIDGPRGTSEINQSKTNTVWFNSYVEFKKQINKQKETNKKTDS